MKYFFKKWWHGLIYEPGDPRLLAGSDINIVVIGGGTGLSNLLKGLKLFSKNITAVVAVTDDGSSSGSIRKEFDILPPGDIRKCISALALDEELVSNIMEFRFSKGSHSFSGHTLGNIWITGLSKYLGSFEKALETTTEIFKTAGRVVPATLDNIQLCAEFIDGKILQGESKFVRSGKSIKRVFISKKNVRAYQKAVEAIKRADLIVIGPGSLYTSVIPNLLISGIRENIRNNKRAKKIYIANCSTERGETENYSIEDHIEAIIKHGKGKLFDYCLVNSNVVKKSGSRLGQIDNITTDNSAYCSIKIIKKDLVNKKNPLYHDSYKLANAIIELYNG